MRIAVLISLPVALVGGAASAEPAAMSRLVLVPAAKAADAAALNAAVLAPDRQAHDLPQPGVAKTAVDRRFERQGATGAIGFLCGRPDSLDERASGQPLGSDPQGRFLGARLSFAFR
jgi:hypothetical protein